MSNRSKALTRIARTQGTDVAYIREQGIEAFKASMDVFKRYLERFDTSSPNLYVTRIKQMLASCQMTSVNDPSNSVTQHVAFMSCMVRVKQAVDEALEAGWEKEAIKAAIAKVIEETASMFGLQKKSSKRKSH